MTARQIRRVTPVASGPPMTPKSLAPATRPVNPCRSNPDLFFSDDPEEIKAAKNMCGNCPITASCLRYANDHEIYDGVWGGLTGEERSGGSKRCGNCNVVQPLGLFHRHSGQPDGRSTFCKACIKVKDARRNALRKPQRAAYKRAYRQKRQVAA